MPIYEYQCGACNHSLEYFEKITDKPQKNCPNCNKPELNRLVSAAGFQLKGTGWYVTDFKDKKQPKNTNNNESKKNSSDTESKSTTTTSNDKVDK